MNTRAINKQLNNAETDRAPIVQKQSDGVFVIQSDGAFDRPVQIQFSAFGMSVDEKVFNLYEYYVFTREIGERMAANWASGKGIFIREWGAKKAASFAGKRIHREWREHLKTVSTDVLAVHKAIFVATFGNRDGEYLPLESYPDIYENRYLINDVINNRAAAIVLANLPEIIAGHCKKIGVPYSSRDSIAEHILQQLITDKWNYWPALLSATAQPYSSLTKTLSNLPGRIPAPKLKFLQHIKLERPVTNRRELLTQLEYMRQCHEQREPHNWHVIHHATTDQIKKSAELLSEHLHCKLNPDKLADVEKLTSFILDYPHLHSGNLAGLTKNAIRWHTHQQEEEREKIVAEYGGNQRLAMPPVALPTDTRVTFLATIDDLCAEKQLMRHCIISYTEQAMNGNCYLFHVEHENEHATVEVLHSGEVAQSQGPGNTANAATKLGKRILRKWGRTIPAESKPIIYPVLKQPVMPQQREPEQIHLHMPSPFLDSDIIQAHNRPDRVFFKMNNTPFSDRAMSSGYTAEALQGAAQEINEWLGKAKQGIAFNNDPEHFPLPDPPTPPALKKYISDIYGIEPRDVNLLKIDVPFS